MNTAAGTHLTVHHENGTWWAESSTPGWTVAADTLERLNDLLREPSW